MLRSLLGRTWRQSPAHLLLLSRFLSPRALQDFTAADEWRSMLGKSPEKAIRRFLKEGFLQPAGVERSLGHKYTVADLKVMLRQRGLSVSGRKAELISRLVEADPKGMRKAAAEVMLLECSERGRELAEEYLAEEQRKREAFEEQVIEALKHHKFRDACMLVAAYEAQQVFPRGMGIDWKHYNPSNEARRLRAIFALKPKRLSHLTDEQLEPVRVAAGMLDLMWNVGQATEWLEANCANGLGVPCRVAVLVAHSYAMFRTSIDDLRQAGYKWVRITTCNDDYVCDTCRKLTARRYSIDKVPELPYEKCTSEVCRCGVVGSWS